MSQANRTSTDGRRASRDRRPQLHLVDPPNDTRPSRATTPVSSNVPAWARQYRARLAATDSLIIVVAVMVAFASRFWWGESAASLAAIAADYWMVTLTIIGAWIISLSAYHSRDSRVVGIGLDEYRRVVNASVVTFGLLAIIFLMFKVDIARGFFVLALPLGITGLALNRLLWRKWLARQRQEGLYLHRAIVVGDEADVDYVVKQIDKRGVSLYHVIGAAITGSTEGSITVNRHQLPIVSSLSNVAEAASYLGVDAVIVAGNPGNGSTYIRDLGWDLEGSTTELVVASQLTNVAGPRIHFRPVEGLPLMHVELPQFGGGRHLLKRAADVIASSLALILLMPLMLVIAWLVHRDSRGPILFRQERIGRGGQPFPMLKFRSMVATAEDDLAGLLDKNEGAGALFKMKNDPRVTRVGEFLRKYSLDELPQLWNILVGDMSLVGPRPPLEREVATYENHVHRRLYIKPGLTGMWQVNGRSNLDWDESVRLDLYYVENWSLAGDLVIMWRTLKVIRGAVGAY
ncbi:sugar transferase [Marisediminicola antarctica]|uniref:sugar transferase n=1 Tax=Marisediminicola antarctica TaxID=674079 RepID=UPI001F2F180A|nr:sugar transferase [Marisediminicola antarctica]